MTNEEQQMDEDNNHGEWKVVQGGHGKGPRTEDRQPNADAAEMESSPSTQEPVLVRFKIITGDFRMEPEVLAMLHVEHPAVKIKIKNTRTRSSILITRDEMTIKLLVIRQHKREENVIQPHGTCWREPYLRADKGVVVCSRGTAASRSCCHLCDKDETLVQAEQVGSTDGDGQGPTRGQGASSALHQGLRVIQDENLQAWSSAMFQLPEVRASGRFMHSGSTDLSILCRSAHKHRLQREDRHHPEMLELQRTTRNDFHELSGKKERSRVHGPDCHPDKASYGSTQESSKEDRRDIRTSSTGLSRQYQCCRDPQLQAIRSEHPIYATQKTSGIGLSTAAEGSSTTEGRTVQTLYMGKTEDTGQTARGRGTGTSYNYSGTSGILESGRKHETRESSADSSSDQDDRGSSRCNQTTDVMHNDRHDLRIVSWNAQGANMKTARIQDAVQQDSIDVLMLQDTRYTERQDSLPPLVSDRVPSECAQQQLRIGDGTESLSVRVHKYT